MRAIGHPGYALRAVARVIGVLLVIYTAAYAFRYVVLGRWAWVPMLAASFEERPAAIFLHALGGSVALVTGLTQIPARLRARAPTLHRALGRTYALAAVVAGTAGTYMAAFSAGGWAAHLGFGVLGVATLATTVEGVRQARARDVVAHRRWMLRSWSLMLAAVTLRGELPLLAAFVGPVLGYQLVSWTCWVPNLLVVEWWLGRRSVGLARTAAA